MKPLRKIFLGTVLVLLVLAVGAAFYLLYPGKQTSLAERVELLKPGFVVSKPEGEGPFPVVLLFHGCGGLRGEHGEKDIMNGYARTAREAGYASIIVDSFGPRDIDFHYAVSKVCKGYKLRGRARAGDVLAAVSYAKSLSFVDAGHIILAGWSHGGWTVMDTMTMDMEKRWPAALKRPPADILGGLQGVYLTYPFCGFPALSHERSWVYRPPTSVIVAEYDEVVQLGRCAETLIKLDADGVVLEVEVFEHVTHAFDERDQTAKSSFSYDDAASSRAHRRFEHYLLDITAGVSFPNPDRVMVDVG